MAGGYLAMVGERDGVQLQRLARRTGSVIPVPLAGWLSVLGRLVSGEGRLWPARDSERRQA